MKIIDGVKRGAVKAAKKVSGGGSSRSRSKPQRDMPDLEDYSTDASDRSSSRRNRNSRNRSKSRPRRGAGDRDRDSNHQSSRRERIINSVNKAIESDREARERMAEELNDSSTLHSTTTTNTTKERVRRRDRGRSPMKDSSRGDQQTNAGPALAKSLTRERIKTRSAHRRLGTSSSRDEDDPFVDHNSPALSSSSSALASASASAAAAAASAATAAALAASLIPTDGSDAMPKDDPIKVAKIAQIVAQASEAASAAAKAAQELVTTLHPSTSTNDTTTSATSMMEDSNTTGFTDTTTATTAMESEIELGSSMEFGSAAGAQTVDPSSSLASMGISLVN